MDWTAAVGIDWIRMKPRPRGEREALGALVQAQAVGFQSMPYYWNTGWQSPAPVWFDLQRALHQNACFTATNELGDLLEFAQYDQ